VTPKRKKHIEYEHYETEADNILDDVLMVFRKKVAALLSTVTGEPVARSENSIVVAENAICGRYANSDCFSYGSAFAICVTDIDVLHNVFFSFVYCAMTPTKVLTRGRTPWMDGRTAICVTI
jgi:hypothetical protein